MSMALHVPMDGHSVVGWQLMLNYMRTPPTHNYLNSCGQASYMEIHLQLSMIKAFKVLGLYVVTS